MNKIKTIIIIFLIALIVFPFLSFTTNCKKEIILDKTELAFLNLINEVRTKNNLSQLISNQKLMNLAKLRCGDMINRNYLSHYTPEGKRVRCGEIISMATFGKKNNINGIFNSWLNSRLHKEVILNPIYTKIGIGIIDNKDSRIVVILFSSR